MLSFLSANFLATKRFLYRSILFCCVIAVTVYGLYQWQLDSARQQEYQFYKKQLNDKLSALIQGKAEITQAIAISITTLPVLKQAIQHRDIPIHPILAAYSQRIKAHTPYKEVWIQLIDAQGISIGRSWTKHVNDDLSLIRQDVASLIEHPRYLNNFSVGKFALTFKSLVPIYDKTHELMGILEVISHVNSIDRMLSSTNGVRSVVLVNRDYRSQLTRSKTGKFIEDYYIANDAATDRDMARIQQAGVMRVFENAEYMVFDDHLLLSHPLWDLEGKRIANWVMVLPIASFQFANLQQTKRQFVVITGFIIVLMLLLAAMVYFKHRSDFERRFFFDVFDTATEMIYVLKSGRIMLANKQFFEFFHSFKSVAEFHQKHDCICEFFVSEDGYLKAHMGQEYWLDYLLNHPEKMHYVKIQQADKVSIFLIKASDVRNELNDQYVSVIMSDVTEEVHYKNQLEHLIIQDELTGIYNRHYFNQALNREIKRHHRYQTSLSIAFLDIDHFKTINDLYGHDVGDAVLRDITKVIGDSLRDTDIFCRIGGEEFVVIMPQTNLRNAREIAERIRVSVERIASDHVPKTVTVSIGVAELLENMSANQLYKVADRALYQAIEKGRNRVEPKV